MGGPEAGPADTPSYAPRLLFCSPTLTGCSGHTETYPSSSPHRVLHARAPSTRGAAPGRGWGSRPRALSPVAEALLSRDSWRCCSIICLQSHKSTAGLAAPPGAEHGAVCPAARRQGQVLLALPESPPWAGGLAVGASSCPWR